MKRRDLLAGLAAAPLLRLPGRRQDESGQVWRFELDDRQRWSLRGPRQAVIAGAEISIVLSGGVRAALADLSGVRRLRSGNRELAMWTVVGRFEGLEVSAQFADGPEPRVGVRVRGLDEPRGLEFVHFTGGVSVAQTGAWINGWQSWSPCSVVPVTGATDATSHWLLALLGVSGLGLLFGEEDAGAGEYQLTGRRLDARARFGGRQIGAVHAPAAATLSLLPANDPLEALGAAAGERAGFSLSAPATGWRSSFAYHDLGEDQLLEALAQARARLDPRAFRYFQVDDGYQKAAGDWDTTARFPHGHVRIAESIRAAGFEPALWLAPFAVAESAALATEHPEWLVRDAEGPVQVDRRPAWGGRIFALDSSLREVQDWLRGLTRQALQDWGYSRLVFDHCHFAAAGDRRLRGASPEEAARAGLRALREGASRAAIAFSGVPLQPALGRADTIRTNDHPRANWDGVRIAAPGLLLRAHLAGRAWTGDAGAVLVGDTLSLDEARAWASIVALTGSVTMSSEVLSSLAPERLEILQRISPAVALTSRVLDLQPQRPGASPPSWLVTQPAADWWMVVAINWNDEPQRLTMNLESRGVRGTFAACDAWTLERLPDVRGALGVNVPAHGVRVVALRRQRAVPFVLASSRHLVQGAVDTKVESWNPATRQLAGTSTMLDGRPYRMVIAAPAGFRAQACAAVPDGTMAQDRTTITLDFPGTSSDIDWQVSF